MSEPEIIHEGDTGLVSVPETQVKNPNSWDVFEVDVQSKLVIVRGYRRIFGKSVEFCYVYKRI